MNEFNKKRVGSAVILNRLLEIARISARVRGSGGFGACSIKTTSSVHAEMSEVIEELRPVFDLASSRAIVEAHEGTIGFEGDAAGGTRFWFRLPVAEH